MRLSRANIPLASEDRTHSQAIWPSPHYNLAPHSRPGFINLQHFCHSRSRNPVRLSKSGLRERPLGPAVDGWITSTDLYRAVLDRQPYQVRGLVGFGANLLLSHADAKRGA